MHIPRRARRRPLLSISAMSDIAFLLLIFILLISLIHYRREIPIRYPEAETGESIQGNRNLEIWIDSTGNLFVQGIRYDLEGIEEIIAEGIQQDPSIRIHILADRNTPYKFVHGVMGILQKLEHRVVSLVVQEKEPE
ncbi:MAG: hypothetical protein Kow009_16520 [Spirochaetales bacterium]